MDSASMWPKERLRGSRTSIGCAGVVSSAAVN